MQTVLCDTGAAALAQAIANGTQLQVVAYHIGQAANFQPATSSTDVSPSSVYTGDASTVSPSLVNGNEVRYTITILEPAGPFNVGNIMLYLQDENGNLIPYLYGVLPIAVPKYQNNPPSTIGNRLVFNMTAMYTNVASAFTLQVVTPTYASLPNYIDETQLPAPQSATYQQSILQNITTTGSPGMAARRDVDNSWFIQPFFQRIDDPDFGDLKGGIAGDNYLPYYGDYYAAGTYTDPVGAFNTSIDGGVSWGVPGIADSPIDAGPY